MRNVNETRNLKTAICEMAGTRSRWTEKVDVRVLAGGGLLVVAGLLLRARVDDVWPWIMEGVLYVGCLVLLAAHKPLRQMFESLPRGQRAFLLSLVGMMVVAQIWSQPLKSFPMVAWDMYSESSPPPFYYEYVGICADGREIEFPAGSVFRSQHRTALFKLNELWWKMNSTTDQAEYEQLSQRYHSLLTALVKRFNEQHPETQVQLVRLIECTMPKPAPGRKLNVTRWVQQEFTVR
jgi:hypothetical protein